MTIAPDRNDLSILNDIQELIEIRARNGEVYIDSKTGRYREYKTDKIVPKSKMEAAHSREARLLPRVINNMEYGDVFDVAFSDYFPELSLGRMNDSASWFYEIGSGIRPYAKRSASDCAVISHGDDLVDAMIAVYQIACGIESGAITQWQPLSWYTNHAILHAYSKTAPVMEKIARTSDRNGMFLLLKAREDKNPMPSRLEIWLAMNPRDLFTTEEGRAERDRLAARLEQGETTLRCADDMVRDAGTEGRSPCGSAPP